MDLADLSELTLRGLETLPEISIPEALAHHLYTQELRCALCQITCKEPEQDWVYTAVIYFGDSGLFRIGEVKVEVGPPNFLIEAMRQLEGLDALIREADALLSSVNSNITLH